MKRKRFYLDPMVSPVEYELRSTTMVTLNSEDKAANISLGLYITTALV